MRIKIAQAEHHPQTHSFRHEPDPERIPEKAEHFRKAAENMSVGSFARSQLETMERSYRTLAESEAALRNSIKQAEALAKLTLWGQ